MRIASRGWYADAFVRSGRSSSLVCTPQRSTSLREDVLALKNWRMSEYVERKVSGFELEFGASGRVTGQSVLRRIGTGV